MNIARKIIHVAYNRFALRSEYYKKLMGGVNTFWHIPSFNLDVVNLGNDNARSAFNYLDTGLKGMNWAVESQPLTYDFSVLKNYFSYLKKGATVIISLSPLSGLSTTISKEQNLRYYTFLHPATIQDFEESEHVKALTMKGQNLLKVAPIKTISGIVVTWARNSYHKLYGCNFKQHSAQIIKIWKDQYGIEDFESELSDRHRSELKQQSKMLHEMITFCIERELSPVLVIPPIHPELMKNLSDQFFDHYIRDFVNKANLPDIKFLCYLSDSCFQQDKDFDNTLCLSSVGAKKFTRRVLKDLGLIRNN